MFLRDFFFLLKKIFIGRSKIKVDGNDYIVRIICLRIIMLWLDIPFSFFFFFFERVETNSSIVIFEMLKKICYIEFSIYLAILTGYYNYNTT